MITKVNNKVAAGVFSLLLFSSTPLLLGSCTDFFEQESEHVIYSDKDHLYNWSDTVYSVMGILSKLQVVADRTILLGEVRGDLVSLTSEANSDLRDVATFNIGDDNQYNQPRDYYAIINNCNYYIAHADTALKSNRNEYIFMKEYAAVKAIRAWVYLQLGLNYGNVPFVTEPILTKEESERDYPSYSLEQICEFFLKDLATLPERYDTEYPYYGDNVRGNDSRVFFFPLNIIRGDLNLYLGCLKGTSGGRQNFEQAALCYYKYISNRNGLNSYYGSGIDFCMHKPGTSMWTDNLSYLSIPNGAVMGQSALSALFYESGSIKMEHYSPQGEIITMIPGDSIRAEGNYSELRNLFYSRSENDNKVSITPSKRIQEISAAQVNCCLASNGVSASYAPTDLSEHRAGDLRLSMFWMEDTQRDDITGGRIETQYLYKYVTRNVRIYRRQMIYLRLAEALNWAGYPLVAFKILQRGLSDKVFEKEIYPYISVADSTWLATNMYFDNQYKVIEAEDLVANDFSNANSMGIHTRGSGYTPMNDFYTITGLNQVPQRMLEDSTYVFDDNLYASFKAAQQKEVDSLIINESALEFAFEGTRFYDLMRYAWRQPDPGLAMENFILARRGEQNRELVQSDLKKSLRQQSNWFLNWNGRLGMTGK